MKWAVEFLPEAKTEYLSLDGSTRHNVARAIAKVQTNPYSCMGDAQGHVGYGKPLGNKNGLNLAGLLKIKLRKDGVRIVYKLEEENGVMKIVVVGVRADMEVYKAAYTRRVEHDL